MEGSGYIATVIGSGVGAFVLGWAGGLLGLVSYMGADPHDPFAGLAGAVIGGALGGAAGVAVGAWIGLRWRQHDRATMTACLVGLAAPIAVVATFLGTTSAIERWFPAYDHYIGFIDQQAVTTIALVVSFVVAAVSARLVAVAWPSRPPWGQRP